MICVVKINNVFENPKPRVEVKNENSNYTKNCGENVRNKTHSGKSFLFQI